MLQTILKVIACLECYFLFSNMYFLAKLARC